jgi:fatty acid desaturase
MGADGVTWGAAAITRRPRFLFQEVRMLKTSRDRGALVAGALFTFIVFAVYWPPLFLIWGAVAGAFGCLVVGAVTYDWVLSADDRLEDAVDRQRRERGLD